MAERRFSDIELERSLANDLPAQRMKELAARSTDADRLRLEELRTEHREFLSRIDVDAEVRAIGRRAVAMTPEAPTRPWWRWVFAGGALAAAAAAILFFVTRREIKPPADDDIGIKGDAIALIVHVATGAQSQPLKTGDTVEPGARIRFEINAGRRGYVAIVGLDGSGATTIYYPYNGSAPAAIDPRAERLLPGAIELDATPGDERFFAVFSERPFVLDPVVAAIKGRMKLPDGMSSAEVVLHKGVK